MNRVWNNFCVAAVLLLTFSFKSQAQTDTSNRSPIRVLPVFLPLMDQSQAFFNKNPSVQVNLGNTLSHWGIMCFGEYKLEKKTGIPFRFRLGSLEYVNKLEGKK